MLHVLCMSRICCKFALKCISNAGFVSTRMEWSMLHLIIPASVLTLPILCDIAKPASAVTSSYHFIKPLICSPHYHHHHLFNKSKSNCKYSEYIRGTRFPLFTSGHYAAAMHERPGRVHWLGIRNIVCHCY